VKKFGVFLLKILLLNTETHPTVVMDKSVGDEPYWIQPEGLFTYYLVQNVDIIK
jgi:hypothetical protein